MSLHAEIIEYASNGDVGSLQILSQRQRYTWGPASPILNLFGGTQDFGDALASKNNQALMAAIENGHIEVVEWLLKFDAVRNQIAFNTAQGFDQIACWALVHRKYIGIDVIGHNPLWLAALKGDISMLNMLLAIDAVKKNVAAGGNMVLLLAAEGGNLAVVDRLLEFAEVRDEIASSENGALRLAALKGEMQIVDRLLEFDAVKNKISVIDLQHVVWGNNLAILNRLLEYEAARNGIEKNGNALLSFAISVSSFLIINELLKIPAVRDGLTSKLLLELNYRLKKELGITPHQALTQELLEQYYIDEFTRFIESKECLALIKQTYDRGIYIMQTTSINASNAIQSLSYISPIRQALKDKMDAMIEVFTLGCTNEPDKTTFEQYKTSPAFKKLEAKIENYIKHVEQNAINKTSEKSLRKS